MTRHLLLNLYRLILDGHVSARVLAWHAHRHLMDRCGPCSMEWGIDQEEVGADLPFPVPFSPAAPIDPLPASKHQTSYASLDRRIERQKRIRAQQRLARRHLKVLLEAPPDRWKYQVERARTRFRTRAFADLLVEEARRRVRESPIEAAALATLVPVVVRWIPGAHGKSWAAALVLRATAWEANAHRVSGDLQRADRIFRDLRWRLDHDGPCDPDLVAEITSLEASLRIGQRRFAEARELLERSRRCTDRRANPAAECRALAMLGNLALTIGAAEEALQHFRRAEEILPDLEPESELILSVLNGQVATLCDLDRPLEARKVLAATEHRFRNQQQPFTRAVLLSLWARVTRDLDQGALAVRHFRAAQQAFLEADRTFDAALVSLDLAQVHLEAGRLGELHDLAADLVVQFQARGVARETLAALRLLARAAAAREVSRELLGKVREQLRPGRARPAPGESS